jgi:hypothetical protein
MKNQREIDGTRAGLLVRQVVLPEVFALLLLIVSAGAADSAGREAISRAGRSSASGVPTYNVEAECREAASVARLLETTAPLNAQSCIEDERRAREQLVEVWSQFDAADRVMCNGVAKSGGAEPTYTELMSCLEVARDNHQRNARETATEGRDRDDALAVAAAARTEGTQGRQANRRSGP